MLERGGVLRLVRLWRPRRIMNSWQIKSLNLSVFHEALLPPGMWIVWQRGGRQPSEWGTASECVTVMKPFILCRVAGGCGVWRVGSWVGASRWRQRCSSARQIDRIERVKQLFIYYGLYLASRWHRSCFVLLDKKLWCLHCHHNKRLIFA